MAIPEPALSLRGVFAADLEVFLRHQLDAEANRLAGTTARTREEFLAHWQKTAADPAVRRLTIVRGGAVAGYVGSFLRSDQREVCYWLGREFWGRGLATSALRLFLDGERRRPLYARVAKRNPGSVRVLEKCGFALEGTDSYSNRAGEVIEEFVFRSAAA